MDAWTTVSWSLFLLVIAPATAMEVGCSTGTCTCTPSPCGTNAHCSIIGGRPVCSCFKGYSGDPLSVCTRAECLANDECRHYQTCSNGRCIDPCAGSCGVNADCEVRNHVPVCSCPPGYTGSPFVSCRRFDPSELCHPSPCGSNTNCEVVNGVPTCKCLPGFQGSPLAGCRHECESDSECGNNLACIDFKCQNPCNKQCGESADCEIVRNHQAVCKCPKNYFGDPYVSCKPECYGDVDCPRGRPACFYGICKNPCDGVCGAGANCELRGLTPVCSCPKDMTGDPFVRCRPFTPEDLCEPNPCGANARCEPGFETRTGKERPVCFCLTGYTGDPVRGCQRGECTEDSHCPPSQACIEYRCQNPCVGQCGTNAECNARNHVAVCTCPSGYQGDALYQCNLNRGTSAARYLRYKRTSEETQGNATTTIVV
ncbi:neurogenic locus notch homolog protein 1 isoform X2 [Cylas formicarius]|uniref:neurogenic locus notch homolog protein 1 isoform X2 n=1 Tax=Cylas formicarius TaxID=197179 RepID=UPI002958A5D5|nr:neurogenic locus notch homolog protein 1 isoform X2 [Cylas formicarius]